MLKLKKLQILGFKSFCDRTELRFSGNGVVGIVGPNGCGKSNIADAISWVLGEQSAKTLRGGRMEDVIFAGTRERPATGMAEVSLTLVDPQEYELELVPPAEAAAEGNEEAGENEEWEVAPAEQSEAEAQAEGEAGASGAVVLTIRKRRKFVAHNRRGEIVVTRRLFRDGESEYLMNGRPCRLRDIQELFMGTGLGPESYAIIEQGRIGQILSSKPYDRRAVIEEAAGVGKYKAKRRLAEARLESARQNLARINDIFEEVTRQVGSLKRQASKAQRYQALKADFDRQQRLLLASRGQALAAAQAELTSALGRARQQVDAAQAAVAEQEAARAEAAARCSALEAELRRGTEETGRRQRERDQARQQIEFGKQQAAELANRLEAGAAEARVIERQTAEVAGELGEAQIQADAAGELAEAARAELAARRERYAAAAQAAQAVQGEIEIARQRSLELMRRMAALGSQISQNETLLAGIEQQLERWAREEESARRELEAGGERRGQLWLTFQDQRSEAESLQARWKDLETKLSGLNAEQASARAEERSRRTQLAETGARRRSLEEVVAHHGYSSEAVKRLFAEDARREGFEAVGVLGEFVEVEAPYERVVEQFLQDELNYVVVKNWDHAGAGVGLLRSREQGRATFLVHPDGYGENGGTGAGAAEGPGDEPGVRALLHDVKALNGFRQGLGAILPKLRQAYLARDGEQARRLAASHPQAYFLTPDGECYHHLTVTGGSGAGSGPLSLKRELRELQRAEAAQNTALAETERRLAWLEMELAGAGREREQVQARRHELEKQLLTSGQAVREVEGELARAQARLQQALMEAGRARASRQRQQEALSAARDEQEQADRELAVIREREQNAATAAEAARGERETAAAAMAEAQAECARVEERARAAAGARERLERQRAELERRGRAAAEERAAIAGRRQQIERAEAALLAAVAELEAAVEAQQAAMVRLDEQLREARTGGETGELALAAGRQTLEARRQGLSETEVALARLEADLDHLRQACRDDLGCELAELGASALAAADGGEAAPVLAELETAVRELRQKIETLGPVNMMALEEFQEAEERHRFLGTQRQDLLDSIADTQKAIQEMDSISRQKFQEAFERINTYFQESFRVLFGGGQGFLRLSEMEAPGDAGVDIVAQPPGKKLQNALLLSGGEKAMTAMALLLAVFRYQPSPFCLLDEVDAPMDEANVVRFSEMVKQMSANTQFIMITHNRRTMEAAPTLYGVTMSQPGVSRLVSVLVEDAPLEAARRAAG